MKITLVSPPLSDARSLGLGRLFFQKYEPLGILYIAAVAKEPERAPERVKSFVAQGVEVSNRLKLWAPAS